MGRFETEASGRTEAALTDIGEERERQFTKWGPQHHPDGTNTDLAWWADKRREHADMNADMGRVSWHDILMEEVAEASAERDLAALRKELVQVAAVAVAWIEDIDSRERPGCCPCVATNHSHRSGWCDEPQPSKGYVVCVTCRYATSPER